MEEAQALTNLMALFDRRIDMLEMRVEKLSYNLNTLIANLQRAQPQRKTSMPTALTIIRHLAAVLAAWLTTTLVGALGLDVGPETLAEVEGVLTTLGGTVLLALYAVVEKALKPLFHRLGEPRPVEVDLEGLNPDVLSALARRVQNGR